MNTKNILKLLKLNESTISMVMGALVVVVVGWVVVSYFRNSSSTPSVTEEAANTQEDQNEPGTYVVSKGDSLWKIAEGKFGDGYKWVEIAHANGITNPDQIEVGQKLTIPETEVGKTAADTGETVKAPVKSDNYVVSKGDSLWSIAVKNYGDGYKWVEIAKANNLTNPNVIHAGNVFTLPDK